MERIHLGSYSAWELSDTLPELTAALGPVTVERLTDADEPYYDIWLEVYGKEGI